MFESIMNFFKRFGKNEKEHSKEVAKERLHLVLAQDRANISADFLEMMKQEIIDVIKKYIDIDEEAIDVRMTNKPGEDGTVGAPALYANIPIVTIKNDARKLEGSMEKQKEEEKQKQQHLDEKTTETEESSNEKAESETSKTESPEEIKQENQTKTDIETNIKDNNVEKEKIENQEEMGLKDENNKVESKIIEDKKQEKEKTNKENIKDNYKKRTSNHTKKKRKKNK